LITVFISSISTKLLWAEQKKKISSLTSAGNSFALSVKVSQETIQETDGDWKRIDKWIPIKN